MPRRQSHRKRVLHLRGLHPENILHVAGPDVHLAEREDVGNPEGVAIDLQAGRHRQLATGEQPDLTGRRVVGLDRVVGHVRNVDRPVRGDRQVVERSLQLLRDGFPARGELDLAELPGARVDDPQVALAVEVRGSRCLELAVDHGDPAVGRIDLHDLALEPQRTVEHSVGADLEAVEAAHVLRDQARRLLASDVDLPERIAEEDLRRVELAVAAVEVDRVEAGQVLGQHAQGRRVVLAIAQHPHQVVGPRELALRTDGDVVGLAFRRGNQDLRRTCLAVDFPHRVADHAAGKQPPLRVDGEPVHSRE